jgi:phage recombination protein Bet
MSTELATTTAPPQRVSLVAKMAERFNVEPVKLMGTLKATAFKSDKPVSDEQMMALLIVADQHGLNPFTKEIFAFPDKGGIVPVVSVDGWARIINEHPMFDGVAFTYVNDEDGLSCTCTIHRKDRGHPTAVTEYFSECKRGTIPWGSHPRRMLRHKSLIQCARLAFGFAGIYDEDEARRIIETKHMGAAHEVHEPASTSAQHVRQALGKPDPLPMAEEVEPEARRKGSAPPPPPPPPAPAPSAFAVLVTRLEACSDPEIAALILDEGRELDDPDHEALAALYRTKFPATTN